LECVVDLESLRQQLGNLAALQEELERLRKENAQLKDDLTKTQNILQSKL
jgi:cell shape-determining protein MreC